MIPTDIQGYIRHILHSIGVMIVAYGGTNQEMMEIYVGLLVNLISLGWFAVVTYNTWNRQKAKQVEVKEHEDVSDDT